MSFSIQKIAITITGLFAVFYPVFVWFQNSQPSLDSTQITDIFPVLGLVAFSLMYLHIVGGVFRNWLNRYIDFQQFVAQTSIIVLILIILHPLLFLIQLTPPQIVRLFTVGQPIYIWLGIIAWIIFVGYDIAKLFKTHLHIAAHWQLIKFISTLAFFFILFHSLHLGSDLQTSRLRFIWIFYGITALLATIYTYIIKDRLQKSAS